MNSRQPAAFQPPAVVVPHKSEVWAVHPVQLVVEFVPPARRHADKDAAYPCGVDIADRVDGSMDVEQIAGDMVDGNPAAAVDNRKPGVAVSEVKVPFAGCRADIAGMVLDRVGSCQAGRAARHLDEAAWGDQAECAAEHHAALGAYEAHQGLEYHSAERLQLNKSFLIY